MTADAIPYWFVLILSGFSTFFIIRFYNMVEEIRKDVKMMLQSVAQNKIIVDRLEKDFEDLKEELHEQRGKISDVEKSIAKIKPQR